MSDASKIKAENKAVKAKTEDDQDGESDYNEEEDVDYVEGAGSGDDDASADEVNEGDDDDEEDKTEIAKAKYDSIENAEGGLIKTRTQRAKEEAETKSFKKAQDEKTTVDIDSFWKEMKTSSASGAARSNSSGSASPSGSVPPVSGKEEPEKIKIKSTYEFAGKIVTEEKWVDSGSAEAKAYLGSVKLKSQGGGVADDKPVQNNGKPPARKGFKRKRPSLLDAVINDEKTAKLSTLEKSRLDWSSYVDKEGIQDELKNNNKGGYLQKQDFLNRVQRNADDRYKAVKAQQQKQQQQQQQPQQR